MTLLYFLKYIRTKFLIGFKVLTPRDMRVADFWAVAPCNLNQISVVSYGMRQRNWLL